MVVIGAGLGGMSAAIMLARNGFQVTVLEKNTHVGGKLNQLQTGGFSFDLGPSIFTLPHIFRPLFEGDGKRLEDYIGLQRVDPQWRNFFEDGVVLDLWEDREKHAHRTGALRRAMLSTSTNNFSPTPASNMRSSSAVTFAMAWIRSASFCASMAWKDARNLDYLRSMSGSIYKRLSNRYLRDIFEYFIKYVGSSALDSPAFMNLMPNIQMEFGLWYVSGGLYQLAHAFRRRLDECGVTVHLGHEVLRIDQQGDAVTGVLVRGPDGSDGHFAGRLCRLQHGSHSRHAETAQRAPRR